LCFSLWGFASLTDTCAGFMVIAGLVVLVAVSHNKAPDSNTVAIVTAALLLVVLLPVGALTISFCIAILYSGPKKWDS